MEKLDVESFVAKLIYSRRYREEDDRALIDDLTATFRGMIYVSTEGGGDAF